MLVTRSRFGAPAGVDQSLPLRAGSGSHSESADSATNQKPPIEPGSRGRRSHHAIRNRETGAAPRRVALGLRGRGGRSPCLLRTGRAVAGRRVGRPCFLGVLDVLMVCIARDELGRSL
jgi:hypothetical protein